MSTATVPAALAAPTDTPDPFAAITVALRHALTDRDLYPDPATVEALAADTVAELAAAAEPTGRARLAALVAAYCPELPRPAQAALTHSALAIAATALAPTPGSPR